MSDPKFTTYHSTNSAPECAWIAYINGWQVRCVGATEDEAKGRALALWNKERARMVGQLEAKDSGWGSGWGSNTPATKGSETPTSFGNGHGNAGKVWMRHNIHGLKRMTNQEAERMIDEGWYKSGPRGK